MPDAKHSYVIRIAVDGDGKVKATLQDVGRSGEKNLRKIETASKRASKEFRVFGGTVRGVAAALGAGALGKSTLDTIKRFELIDLRLRSLTSSTADYTRTQEFLRAKADELNTDLLTLTDSYAKLLALQDAGILNRDEVNQLNEGIINAALAFGASQQQIGLVVFGLSQALGQGTVQAQELNQVIEPLPGFLNAIAEAAGVSAQGFREMVKDGEVSSEQFKDLVIQATSEFAGTANQLTDTAVGSLARLKNAFNDLQRALGESFLVEAITGVTTLTAEVLTLLNAGGNNENKLVSELNFIEAGIYGVGAAINTMFQAAKNGFFGIANTAVTALDRIILTYQGALKRLGLFDGNAKITGLEETILDLRKRQSEASARLNESFRPFNGGNQPEQDPAVTPSIESEIEQFERIVRPSKKPTDADAIKEAEKRAKQIRNVTEALRFRNEQVMRNSEEQELYNQLKEAGVSIDSAEGQEIARLVDEFFRLQEQMEKVNEEQERMARIAEQVGDAFSDSLERTIIDFGSVAEAAEELGRTIVRSLYQETIGRNISSAVTGIAGDLLGSAFGGFTPTFNPTQSAPPIKPRARGGDIFPGQTYLVGENGPELRTFGSAGKIIPNDALGGSGMVSVNIINNTSGDVTEDVNTNINGNGDMSIEVVLDEMQARNINTRGSKTRQAIRRSQDNQILRR